MKKEAKIFVTVIVSLCVCQVLVVLFSWVASILLPNSGITSLLGSEGLRWLFSSYERNAHTSLLFYCLLACVAFGAFFKSGLVKKIASYATCNYNERLGVSVFFICIFVAFALCMIFAFYPHSFLLSIDGTILSATYFKAVLIVVAVALIIGSCLFILFTNSVTPYDNILESLTIGLKYAAPFVVIYFVLSELVCSILYVV